MIPTLLCVVLLIFVLFEITPGDPALTILPSDSWTEENIARVHKELGLDDPILVRYVRYLGNAVQGDLGTSYLTKTSVTNEIAQKFPYTMKITFISVIMAIVAGIPFGVIAAKHQYTLTDNISVFISLLFVSMPNFWFALLLARFFGVQLGWLPTTGVETWTGYILPSATVAITSLAAITRQTRSSMLEQIRQDYVVTARAKGQIEGKVIYGHALKNALIPIITVVGTNIANHLGGTLVAETIFSIPGLAKYMITGLNGRDYPVVLGSVLFISAVFCIVMMVVDIIYAVVDPRIRIQMMKKNNSGRKTKARKEAAAA
jgi:peptide/nickel transport system permease protein